MSFNIIVRGTSLKDKSGERLYWPKNATSYFDQAARRWFKSPNEKKEWMDKNNLISDGSSDKEWSKFAEKAEQEQKDKKGVKK